MLGPGGKGVSQLIDYLKKARKCPGAKKFQLSFHAAINHLCLLRQVQTDWLLKCFSFPIRMKLVRPYKAVLLCKISQRNAKRK